MKIPIFLTLRHTYSLYHIMPLNAEQTHDKWWVNESWTQGTSALPAQLWRQNKGWSLPQKWKMGELWEKNIRSTWKSSAFRYGKHHTAAILHVRLEAYRFISPSHNGLNGNREATEASVLWDLAANLESKPRAFESSILCSVIHNFFKY